MEERHFVTYLSNNLCIHCKYSSKKTRKAGFTRA